MNELVFEVTQEADGGFVAEAPGESIFTEADTWEALRANVREAVRAFYFDRPAPAKGTHLDTTTILEGTNPSPWPSPRLRGARELGKRVPVVTRCAPAKVRLRLARDEARG
jgi:predicted RNase H-like HicB family nuclease